MTAITWVCTRRHPGLLLAGIGCLLIAAGIGLRP